MRHRFVRRLEFFGVVFSPTFRVCLGVAMLIFYIVQTVMHASAIREYEEDHGTADGLPSRLEGSYLAIDVFLMTMVIIQLFWAWSDYQSFEMVLLQTNSCIFGLIIGSLVLSSMSAELHYSSISQLFYALNVLLGLWIAVIDLMDLRPIGLARTFDLLKRARDLARGIQDGNISDNSGSRMSETSTGSFVSTPASKVDAGGHSYRYAEQRDGDVENGAGGGAGNVTPGEKPHSHSFRKAKGEMHNPGKALPQRPYRDFETSGATAGLAHHVWGLEADDVTDGFRVRLDRIIGIAHGTGNNSPPASEFEEVPLNSAPVSPKNGASSPSTEELTLTGGHLPTNVNWNSFTFVEHRIDSSSCHIYTAMWSDVGSGVGNIPVIIKLIKADRVKSPVAVSEFEAEAAVLSCTEHANIVRMLGSGHIPRRFVILELLDGGSLSHSLGLRPDSLNRTRTRKFSYLETLSLARDLANSLDYLHNRCHRSFKIVHRDLKPDNIGWTSDGTIKLFDFGLCCVVRPDDQRTPEGYRMTGNTGTLRYMAPEVALNRPYHHTVDVYSFSIVVWQVLTGQIPFREMGRKRYMDKVVHNGHRPPLNRNWPKRFRDLLKACWHEDKNFRPDFEEVVRELDMLILEEERLNHTGWRKLENSFNDSYAVVKQQLVRIRPFFVLFFFSLAVGSIVSISGDQKFQAAGLAIVSSAGLYLTIVSILRFHVRGDSSENVKSRKGVKSREDILSLSVGLEAGKGSSLERQVNNGKEESMFAMNPLALDESDSGRQNKPLYGL